MTPDEQRVHDEARVLDALVDHRQWVETLPADSVWRRVHGDSLRVGHLCAATGLSKRTVQRVLDRLVAAGAVTRSTPVERSADVYCAGATVQP